MGNFSDSPSLASPSERRSVASDPASASRGLRSGAARASSSGKHGQDGESRDRRIVREALILNVFILDLVQDHVGLILM